MIKRTFVRTRSLKEGMRIDQSIVNRLGKTLIAKGTILDEYMIDSLLKLNIMGVYTSEGEEDEEDDSHLPEYTKKQIQELTVADHSKVKLSESVKKRVSEGVQYLYSNTESSDFADTTNHIANDLMSAIMENDAIAFDIGTLKVSDEYTFKHSVDVATMSMIIARKHGFDDRRVYEIGVAGLLHDVGKSKIPNEVLNKPDKLSDQEFALMKQHTLFGYGILKEKQGISNEIMMGVLQHHEKLNGKGYPLAYSSDKISEYAKILSIADIYDALVTERPYKKAFSSRDAVEMIMSMTEELDIDYMKSFLASVILYPVGSTVKLSNGESARVLENVQECILRPKVIGLKTGKVYDLSRDVNCASILIL